MATKSLQEVEEVLKEKMTSSPNRTLLGIKREKSMAAGFTRLSMTASKRVTFNIYQLQRLSPL